MKKVYLLLACFVGLLGMTRMSAQNDYDSEPDYDNPLIQDVWQFSSPYSDFLNEGGEGNFYALLGRTSEAVENGFPNQDFWHSDWHHNNATPGTHYFQVEMISPETLPNEIVFVYTRRDAQNDQTTEWSVRGTNDPEAEKDQCEELAYILTPFGSQTETLISTPFSPAHYKYLRFYSEAQTGGGGYGSRGYFHVGRFQLYPLKSLEELEAAKNMLMDAFDKYFPMYDSYPPGTEPGQYGEDEGAAFQNAIFGLDFDGLSDEARRNLTKESAQALIDACEAAYQAMLASKVPYILASGYYRIRTGMDYMNRIVIDYDEDGNEITDLVARDKYLMVEKENGKTMATWGTPDAENETLGNISSLFKITDNGDATYDIESMMYNVRFNNVARSVNLEMSAESENKMVFDPVATVNGITYVNISVSTQNAADGLYLHQDKHENGVGVGGHIVGWYSTFDASVGPRGSEWYFENVSEGDAEAVIAAWQPLREREQWLQDYKNLYAEIGQALAAAKDVEHEALIKSVDQLSSPFSDREEGQNLGVLIDGNEGNFWHSDWHNESHAESKHYLQVELLEPLTEPITMSFHRRHGFNNNQIILWSVYGTNTNNDLLVQNDLELLAELETPFGSDTETITTQPFDTKGYKYLRFYCEKQNSNAAFFYMAEFQLYQDHENPNSQYSMMGQVAVDLEKVYNEQAEIADDKLTQADVDKLTAVYEAFKAEFVDPSELRQVIASVEGKTELVAIGTNPGFWPDGTTAEALEKAISDAKKYDVAGVYVKSKSNAFIEDLQAKAEALDNAVIPVEPGKWYRFRVGTEDEYAEHGWPTDGNEETTNDDGTVTNESLFGKYITVADCVSENGVNTVVFQIGDDVAMDNYLYLDNETDIEDADLSLFRFISVGDSAYAIQNKATGLFLMRPKSGSDVRFIRLSPAPSLFTQGIAGYGQNYFPIKNLEGQNLEALHAARALNVVQTWAGWGNTDGRRGSFFVEEAGDVAADYDGTEFQILAKPGTVTTYCFPTTIKGEEGMFGVDKAEQTDNGISLTLVPLKEVEAGRPFIFITEGEYDPEADDAEYLQFTHGYDIVPQPIDGGLLKGTFYQKTVGKGVITFSNNKPSVTKSPSATVTDGMAWIVNGEETFNDRLTVSYTINADGVDAIQDVLHNVARTGDIYTIDGRFVGRGNLSSLTKKGIYIINGTKVVVK